MKSKIKRTRARRAAVPTPKSSISSITPASDVHAMTADQKKMLDAFSMFLL